MFRKYLLISLGILVSLIIIIFIFRNSASTESYLAAEAQKGSFESLVYSSGQLESVEADYIPVPEIFRDSRIRISGITIADLIEEGTYVDSGDYVATIDHSDVDEQYKNAVDELEKIKTEYEDSKIDSNLTLSNQRDQIINAELDLEEKKIIIDESMYESPSVKRKAEMDFTKAERKLEQVKQAYLLKQEQEANKVARKYLTFKQVKERVDLFDKVFDALTITAPQSGIIGYYRYSSGGVIKTTSTISTRSAAIATYPKMDSMVTSTYINEIDISRIKPGQKVTIGIDAFPDKVMNGEISSIANVGQLLPRSDAKVFEVKISIKGSDSDLKPTMTTSNIIQTGYEDSVVFIPLESVFRNDSLTYVYIQNKKIRKQIIETGIENENFTVVKQGVNEGDVVCLTEPENAGSIPFSGMEIYAQIKEKLRLDEEKKNQALQINKNTDQKNGQTLVNPLN
ncbi:MAG: HlyD family efflux transporter periplasmic adaptor subunit [Prolixibacteraceae bacterium]|nr:HlyD family efflux transporter periplasmic adaptor subunit [Prolixibacteraceae bacterium]MBN2773794.1 HlyD family efflux transporter periplasmic adaptor subunit [Prolixibacteraceae bacterium]